MVEKMITKSFVQNNACYYVLIIFALGPLYQIHSAIALVYEFFLAANYSALRVVSEAGNCQTTVKWVSFWLWDIVECLLHH